MWYLVSVCSRVFQIIAQDSTHSNISLWWNITMIPIIQVVEPKKDRSEASQQTSQRLLLQERCIPDDLLSYLNNIPPYIEKDGLDKYPAYRAAGPSPCPYYLDLICVSQYLIQDINRTTNTASPLNEFTQPPLPIQGLSLASIRPTSSPQQKPTSMYKLRSIIIAR